MALSVVLTYKRYIVIIRLPTPVNEAFIVPSFLFPHRIYPPHDEQKETAGRNEKAEPPKREPRDIRGATPAGGAERPSFRSEVGLRFCEK